MTTYVWLSTLRPDQWFWKVTDNTGWYTSGYAKDQWLARAHARVATKTHQQEHQ